MFSRDLDKDIAISYLVNFFSDSKIKKPKKHFFPKLLLDKCL